MECVPGTIHSSGKYTVSLQLFRYICNRIWWTRNRYAVATIVTSDVHIRWKTFRKFCRTETLLQEIKHANLNTERYKGKEKLFFKLRLGKLAIFYRQQPSLLVEGSSFGDSCLSRMWQGQFAPGLRYRRRKRTLVLR